MVGRAVLPGGLGTQQLPWLIGEGWAKRMILLGERVKADKAEQIGLVQEVVPKGKGLEKALELAAKVEGQSPTSVRFCKQLSMAARAVSKPPPIAKPVIAAMETPS